MIRSKKQASAIRASLFIAAAIVCLAGCRHYGSDEAAEATYAQMQKANQVFEEELIRARADLQRLQQAAGRGGVVAHMADQFSQIIRGHEAVLEEHGAIVNRMSGDSDYRELNRAFGSIIAQQRTIRLQYEGLLHHLSQAVHSSDTTSRGIERPYSFIPPYYARVSTAGRDLSLADLLSAASSGSNAAGESTMAPDTSAQSQAPSSDAGAAVDSVAN